MQVSCSHPATTVAHSAYLVHRLLTRTDETLFDHVKFRMLRDLLPGAGTRRVRLPRSGAMTSSLPPAPAEAAEAPPSLLPDFLAEVSRRAGLRRHDGLRQFVVQHPYADTLRLLLRSHGMVPIDTPSPIPRAEAGQRRLPL